MVTKKFFLIFSLFFLGVIIYRLSGTCNVFAQEVNCKQAPSRKSNNTKAWIDNDRGYVLISEWLKRHQYMDCPSQNNGFWYNNDFDCLISDSHPGPSNDEKMIQPFVSELYFKHFTPVNALALISKEVPSTVGLAPLDLIDTFRNFLLSKIVQNPSVWLDKSFDSLYLGIEGGRDGKIIKNAALLVHPSIEGPLAALKNPDGTRARVENLYQPFIQAATGKSIAYADVKQLYENALYNCGDNAILRNQNGRNFMIDMQEYVAIVQYWINNDDPTWFTNTHDCRIAVYPK